MHKMKNEDNFISNLDHFSGCPYVELVSVYLSTT